MRRAAALIALLGLAGCASASGGAHVNILDSRVDKRHPSTYMGLPLATGQIILSEAPGPYSFFFMLVPERFFAFTHAGVIVMEGGEPYVYDVTGRYKPGFDDRPTDAIVGGLRRSAFLDYCRPNLYCEVFDPPAGVDREKVAAFVAEKREKGVVFDAYFRFDEHEKLFCTEFVELALEAGGAKPVGLVPTRKNPSLAVALRYLAVPLETALPAGLFYDASRYLGAIGQFRSRTAATCYFEAKRELHRRFTEDQKLGNLFIFEHADLALRPGIDEFMHAAVALFDGWTSRAAPSDAEIAAAVRKLADDTFGPIEPPAVAAPAPGPAPAPAAGPGPAPAVGPAPAPTTTAPARSGT